MKNKLINTLMLSGVIAATLVGCNSGGNGNVANQTQLGSMGSNNQGVTSSQISNTEKIGAEGNILVDFAAATLSEYINSTVGKVVLNAITGDNENSGQSTKEILNAIDTNFQTLETNLNNLNTTINIVYNNLESGSLGSTKSSIGKITNVLGNNYNNVSTWINKAGSNSGLSQDNINLAESIFTGFSQASMNGAITTALLNSGSTFNANILALSDQDIYQQELTCDNSLTYSFESIIQTENAHQQTVLSNNNCPLANLLNNEIDQFALNSLKQGTNIFYITQGFDQSLDLIYLQVLTALTQAYAVDQLRLFMSLPSTDPAGNLNISTPSVIPSSDVGNYALAESDLALAYNMRLANLQQLFLSAKAQLFNQYTSTINSNNMINQCGLSFESIDAIKYMSQNSSDNSNQFSWDGSNLTVTCQSTPFGQIKTTTNLAALCTTTNGTYNLSSSNGYIRCGAGGQQTNNYGNYSVNNIMTFTEPLELADWWSFYEEAALAYNPYAQQTNASGNLDVMFSGTPLVAWQYNGYDNGGETITYNNPDSKFVDIYFDQYSCGFGNGCGVSSHWSYVDDGVHAYMIAGNYAQLVIACLPNDNNCTFATGPSNGNNGGYNGSYVGLIFSNGDAIAVNQNMGHGDYNIQAFYNGAKAPFNQYSIFNLSNSGQPGQNTASTLSNAFPNVIYGS